MLDVASRALQNRPIAGVSEASEVGLVAIVFLGVAYAQARNDHVATTLVTSRLPIRLSAALRSIAYTVVAITVLWLAWATGERAVESIIQLELRYGFVRIPIWPARACITLGLIALLLEVLIDLRNAMSAALGGESQTDRDSLDDVTPGPAL